ncbi:MAG TPA: hypothetical protein VGC79_33640 [Polyangiaceae bacterium]
MLGLPLRVLKGSGALLLVVLGGCGGRTSAVDSDAFGTDQPASGATSAGGTSTGGTSTGGTSTGGSGAKPGTGATGGATGTAGTAGAGGSSGAAMGGSGATGGTGASTGSAGTQAGGAASGGAAGTASGGASGVSPYNFTNCTNYCISAGQGPCPSGLSTIDCIQSCMNELNDQTLICQTYGQALLSCLTTVYKNSTSCNQVDQLTFAKCSGQALQYQACATPGIDPPPPPPPPPPLNCSSSGSNSNGSCTLNLKCSSGVYYTVSCVESSGNQSNCWCGANLPDGSLSSSSVGLNESVTYACYDSLAACGFPQLGAK